MIGLAHHPAQCPHSSSTVRHDAQSNCSAIKGLQGILLLIQLTGNVRGSCQRLNQQLVPSLC